MENGVEDCEYCSYKKRLQNVVKIYQGSKTLHCEATPWFPPWIKPVHKGVYVVGSDSFSVMNEWNGKYWDCGDGSPSLWQDMSWRGWTGEYL